MTLHDSANPVFVSFSPLIVGANTCHRASLLDLLTKIRDGDCTFLLKTDLTLWSTGYNAYGQLGDGAVVTTSGVAPNRYSPKEIAQNVIFSTGANFSNLAGFVKGDKSLWLMGGSNENGIFGGSTVSHRSTPVKIASDVESVSIGSEHALFVKTDSSAWGIGSNSYGQLGADGRTVQTQPVQIASGVRTAIASYRTSLLLKLDGTLWGCGNNSLGQLGTNPKLKSAIAGKKKDKWVLVGEIKLKTKNTLFIKDLKARWRGGNLGNTFASLYSKKLTDRRLPVPIEENLICDGTWNPTAKEFFFPVNKKLVASDTYYLMLNVPAQYETRLRTGSFEIIQHKKRALLHLKK